MPKKVDHQSRQSDIAQAAIAAIAKKGLGEVRMVDIARAAGATTGSLVHYFEDKDAVIAAALQEIAERLLAELNEAGDLTVFEIACAVLPLDKQTRLEWQVWLQFWGRSMSNPEMRACHHTYYRRIAQCIAASLQTRGFTGDPMPIADAVIAAVDGVGVRAVLEPQEWPPERQIALLKTLVLPLLTNAGITLKSAKEK